MLMNKKSVKRKNKISIMHLFSFTICVIMLITAVITHFGIWLLNYFNIIAIEYPFSLFLFFEIVSTMTGTLAAIFISRKILKPLHLIVKATEQITAGDYSTRLHLDSSYEFEELGEKFNCMAEELNSVEMLRNDFVNQFSHEFNTPISSIHGFANALKQDSLTKEEQDEYLDKIIIGTDRLSNLATNILNLSKIEQQTILTHKNKLNVTEQIRRVIALLNFRWEKKDINFDFDCNEYFLTGNEEILEHLWSNLLDNAIKYSPPQSTISINIQESPSHIIVTLTDQGKGIAEESLPYIFDKFYRSKSSSLTPGTGLGLTIAHKVVMLHHGSIQVSTALGKGTTFIVSLPK